MPPVALATTWLLYVAPSYLLDALYLRRQTLMRDQMVGAALALGSTIRAGMSLPQGLAMTARDTALPLAASLHRVVADFNRGRPLHQALQSMRERLRLDSFTLFSAALQVALERGGDLNTSLDRISRSLQENQRLEKRLATETAAGLRMTQILAVLPLAILLLFQLVSPDEMAVMYQTTIGQVVLAAIILIDYFGARMAWRMICKPV